MDLAVLDCLVTGYEDIEETLKLPDPKDRHVLAAAIRAGAQLIVTKNLQHFPVSELQKFGIEPQHPDEFVGCLLDLSPGVVCASVKRCRVRLRHPAFSVEDYLHALEAHELTQTAIELRRFSDLL